MGDMLAARNGSWRLAHTRAQPAITDFVSAGLGNGLRAYLLKPATGKTHQLRVALKSQGAPILGDARYGGAAAERTYLHAWALRFSAFGEDFALLAPPQEGEHFLASAFAELLQRWQPPWAQFPVSSSINGANS
jgi:tRNA pseudouridine32 synthase/23S rRNA pseudouridine746 synthase